MTTGTQTQQPAAPATYTDPLEAAMNATEQPQNRVYFGEVTQVDVWFCILQTGVGKVLFDPHQHSMDQRRTAIKIVIVPTKGDFNVETDTISTGKDWLKHTLPSLRTLNLDLRTLQGKYVQVKKVSTGEKYTNKSGEEKERTAMVVVAVYPDRAACLAAAEAHFAAYTNAQAGDAPVAAAEPAVNEAEKATAAQSLPLLWAASGKNVQAFLAMVNSNAIISKHFPPDSPEITAFTGVSVPF